MAAQMPNFDRCKRKRMKILDGLLTAKVRRLLDARRLARFKARHGKLYRLLEKGQHDVPEADWIAFFREIDLLLERYREHLGEVVWKEEQRLDAVGNRLAKKRTEKYVDQGKEVSHVTGRERNLAPKSARRCAR